MTEKPDSWISVANNEVFKSWVVYFQWVIYPDYDIMPNRAGIAYESYVHHRTHKELYLDLNRDIDISHQKWMKDAAIEFNKITWINIEELWDYIEWIKIEAQIKNIALVKIAQERAIRIIDLAKW